MTGLLLLFRFFAQSIHSLPLSAGAALVPSLRLHRRRDGAGGQALEAGKLLFVRSVPIAVNGDFPLSPHLADDGNESNRMRQGR